MARPFQHRNTQVAPNRRLLGSRSLVDIECLSPHNASRLMHHREGYHNRLPYAEHIHPHV